jgi:hypothetical protein
MVVYNEEDEIRAELTKGLLKKGYQYIKTTRPGLDTASSKAGSPMQCARAWSPKQ